MSEIKKITSFSVDHDKITKGMYLSRIDGSIYTYDLRTRVPNSDDFMTNLQMHSLEHMVATFARNSEISSKVIYFGPMGCQTGFYLLLDGVLPDEALEFVKQIFNQVLSADKMFGDTRKECGNYKNLSLDAAKEEAARYLEVLKHKQNENLSYSK